MEIVCIVRGENRGSKSYRDVDRDYRAHIQFWEFCFLVTFVTLPIQVLGGENEPGSGECKGVKAASCWL